MATADVQARRELLDAVASATNALGAALAALGAAYEQLDEQQADRLEEQLFRPTQRAYGRAKRTHAAFAGRQRLPGRTFVVPSPGVPSTGVKGFIDNAIMAIERADGELVTLQDSLTPIEYGDPDLRAGLAEVRELISDLPDRAQGFVRTFGR
jgi:hypothetical protein